MAEHKEESVMDKISEKKPHGSSSSGSDDEGRSSSSSSAAAAVKAKIYRLFGREKPVHSVLGGGKRESRARDNPPFVSFLLCAVVGF